MFWLIYVTRHSSIHQCCVYERHKTPVVVHYCSYIKLHCVYSCVPFKYATHNPAHFNAMLSPNITSCEEDTRIYPRPCKLTFDPLTLKVVSESRVTWATSVPISVFLGLSVLDLGPMYTATDRRQTRIIA